MTEEIHGILMEMRFMCLDFLQETIQSNEILITERKTIKIQGVPVSN